MSTRAASSVVKKENEDAEIKEEQAIKNDEQEHKECTEQNENEIKVLKTRIIELQTEKDRFEMRVNNPNEATIVQSSVYQSLKDRVRTGRTRDNSEIDVNMQ